MSTAIKTITVRRDVAAEVNADAAIERTRLGRRGTLRRQLAFFSGRRKNYTAGGLGPAAGPST